MPISTSSYLRPVLAADGAAQDYRLTSETGRHLALWMSYEDVIRVADLKTRASRYARVRAETGAKPHEPVRVVEYLKPGVDEICAILPARLGAWLLGRARERGWVNRLNVGLHLKTTTITGFALLRLLATLTPLRRRSLRFQDEHALMRRWLDAICRAARATMRWRWRLRSARACSKVMATRSIAGTGISR